MMINRKNLLYIAFGIIMFIYMIYGMYSNKFNCDEWANHFKNDFECNLVLTKYSNSSGITTLDGYNPISKKKVSLEDGTKWISMNDASFQIGDTILKKKGKYTIFVGHFKGIRQAILFRCNEKVYYDK